AAAAPPAAGGMIVPLGPAVACDVWASSNPPRTAAPAAPSSNPRRLIGPSEDVVMVFVRSLQEWCSPGVMHERRERFQRCAEPRHCRGDWMASRYSQLGRASTVPTVSRSLPHRAVMAATIRTLLVGG